MKRIALALTLILSLFSTIAVIQISLTEANPFFKSPYCNISIQSPQHTMTYDTGNILLNFTSKTNDYIPPSYYYFYSLDGQDMQSSAKIENVQTISEENVTRDYTTWTETTLRGQVALPELTNGPHSIRVFSGYFALNGKICPSYRGIEYSSMIAWFYINATDASPSSVSSSISEPTFISPQNQPINSRVITINATAHWFFADIKSMSYSRDGKISHLLFLERPEAESFNHMNGTVIGTAVLPALAEGTYSVTVYVEGTVYFPEEHETMEQATVYFTVDVTPPIISDLTVENKTYNQLDLPLEFTVDEPTSWIGYSLDNEANTTLTGNTTLTLKEGPHSITLYANDTAGNLLTTETIHFTIEPVFPTIPVAAGVATTAIVCTSVLIYFKKRK